MEENRIIRTEKKKLTSNISRITQYWLFFKSNILEKEEIRKEFENTELEKKEFRKKIRKIQDPSSYGPSLCRGKSETAKRNVRELLSVIFVYYSKLLHKESPIYLAPSGIEGAGLGIYNKQEIDISRENFIYSKYLFGVCDELEKKEMDELDEKGYPSLFENKKMKMYAILNGPLSLINHDCGSKLGFARLKIKLEEEFQGLKILGAIADKTTSFRKDEEILVQYFKKDGVQFGGSKCGCRTCKENLTRDG